MASRHSTDERRLPPPSIRTSMERPRTAAGELSPARSPRIAQFPEALSQRSRGQSAHQRFVLTDHVAFRYLEEDAATTVLERRVRLQGYECYVVEQWTTSRVHPTFAITTYTGDPSHSVVASVLSVPSNERTWSPRLRVYFKALNQYHARRQETPLGVLMVTNLTGFPSSLTVVQVPDGDLAAHRLIFFVNENLKRLGCSGRVGLTLVAPTGATVTKFHQLYKTSDRNETYKAVIELVKMCQSALMMFDKLEVDYADGLLCDVTERAINDWWVEMGSEFYHVEPHDGILGPTTVAALLGLFMGARNRLHALGMPVAKDPFDIEAMKRGVSSFQRQQHLNRTRRLDRRTLDRLHKASAKHAYSEGWSMPRVVKSTVAELSGKSGEMVMDVVGRRDKAGIAEIETADIEHFSSLVFGDRCRWLWHGKALKKAREEDYGAPGRDRDGQRGEGLNAGLMFKSDDKGGYEWTARKSNADGLHAGDQYDDLASPGMSNDDEYPEASGLRGRVKRATSFRGKQKDDNVKNQRSKGGMLGFGGGHQTKNSQDETPTSPTSDGGKRRPFFGRSQTSPTSPVSSPTSPTYSPGIDDPHAAGTATQREPRNLTDPTAHTNLTRLATIKSQEATTDIQPYAIPEANRSGGQPGEDHRPLDNASDSASFTGPSIAGSIYNDINLNELLPNGPDRDQNVGSLLKRTVSTSQLVESHARQKPNDHFPRHLSFSLAEESILTWTSVDDDGGGELPHDDQPAQMAQQLLLASEAKRLRLLLQDLHVAAGPWTQQQIASLQEHLEELDVDQGRIDSMYHPHVNGVQSLRANAEGLYHEHKERMEEGTREIESLAAKLEYELGALRGRVTDVEVGVQDFQRGVARVEERVTELEKLEAKSAKGWGCVFS